MEQISMTARISAFARAYHREHNTIPVFDDSLAKQLLSETEYNQIAAHMTVGIGYFNPTFSGSDAEALRWLVDSQLSPTPLGRAAFAEQTLQTAVQLGAKQYLIFAAGYDTFAYRQPLWAKKLQIFELDHPVMSRDKQNRLSAAGFSVPDNIHHLATDLTTSNWQSVLLEHPAFSPDVTSFCSLLGLAYYMTKDAWNRLLSNISSIVPSGSTLVFDYPNSVGFNMQQSQLAEAAGEPMYADYAYPELEQLLANCGFLIYEHLTPQEITKQYFSNYNQGRPSQPLTALAGVNYCLAVRNKD